MLSGYLMLRLPASSSQETVVKEKIKPWEVRIGEEVVCMPVRRGKRAVRVGKMAGSSSENDAPVCCSDEFFITCWGVISDGVPL